MRPAASTGDFSVQDYAGIAMRSIDKVRWVQAVDSIHPSGFLLYELEGKEFSINRHLGLVGIVSVADLRILRFADLLEMDERVNSEFCLEARPFGPRHSTLTR